MKQLTIYERVRLFLECHPQFRERKNRGHAICYLLNEDGIYRLSAEALRQAESYNRLFRKVQAENEHLQGKDYDTKDKVEQEYEMSIGYEPRHRQDTRELKQIAML